jgi:hypothetical protein
MVAGILELSPSASGWFYSNAARPAAPVRATAPVPAPARPAVVEPREGLCLGYGPDGSPRFGAPRTRLSLLV